MPDDTSVHAQEGTLAHEAAAAVLTGELSPDDMEKTVGAETATAINKYIRYVQSRLTSDSELLVESKVKLSGKYPGLYGTADALVYDKWERTLEVIDYKHGIGKLVEADDNQQLMYYGLGAYMTNVNQGWMPLTVRLTVVQPRSYESDEDVSSWVITLEELFEYRDRVHAAIEEAIVGGTYRIGTWCQFCKAKGACPAIYKNALVAAKPVITDKEIVLPDVETLTIDELGLALRLSSQLGPWLKAVREYSEHRAKLGTNIPGHKVVLGGRSVRQWVDEKKVVEKFKEKMGDDLFTIKLKSPAQLEKIGIDKEAIKGLTITNQKREILVPVTDKRDSVSPAIENVFTKIKN